MKKYAYLKPNSNDTRATTADSRKEIRFIVHVVLIARVSRSYFVSIIVKSYRALW